MRGSASKHTRPRKLPASQWVTDGVTYINYFENGAITAGYIMLRAMAESEEAGRLINRIMFCFYNDSTRVRW